jgi:hypothetical protein
MLARVLVTSFQRVFNEFSTSFSMLSQACGLAPQGYSPWTSRGERLKLGGGPPHPLVVKHAVSLRSSQ